MPCKTLPSEAQEFFERMEGPRLKEPYSGNESPDIWSEIAKWECRRAEYFSYLMIFDDVREAYRRI